MRNTPCSGVWRSVLQAASQIPRERHCNVHRLRRTPHLPPLLRYVMQAAAGPTRQALSVGSSPGQERCLPSSRMGCLQSGVLTILAINRRAIEHISSPDFGGEESSHRQVFSARLQMDRQTLKRTKDSGNALALALSTQALLSEKALKVLPKAGANEAFMFLLIIGDGSRGLAFKPSDNHLVSRASRITGLPV